MHENETQLRHAFNELRSSERLEGDPISTRRSIQMVRASLGPRATLAIAKARVCDRVEAANKYVNLMDATEAAASAGVA